MSVAGVGRLVIVRGLPGSGKSTLVDRLTLDLATAFRLDPDRVDLRLSVSDPQEHAVYRQLRQQAVTGLSQGRIVFWEQPWRSRQKLLLTIERVALLAYDLPRVDGALPISVGILEVVVPEETARQRVMARFAKGQHRLTVAVFDKEFSAALEPLDDLGFPFLRCDGTDPVEVLTLETHAFVRSIGPTLA